MKVTDLPSCSDGRRIRYASAFDVIVGNRLSEVICKLKELGGNMVDPLIYITEDGDCIEAHQLPTDNPECTCGHKKNDHSSYGSCPCLMDGCGRDPCHCNYFREKA